MHYALTDDYKILVARAMMNEAGMDLKITALAIGDGAFDSATSSVKPPRNTMYNETSRVAVTAVRTTGTITVDVTLAAGSSPYNINEVMLFTAAATGNTVLHGTFAPQTIPAGVTVTFHFSFIPQV